MCLLSLLLFFFFFFSPKIPNTLKDDIQRVRERISCNGFWNDKYQVFPYNQIWKISAKKPNMENFRDKSRTCKRWKISMELWFKYFWFSLLKKENLVVFFCFCGWCALLEFYFLSCLWFSSLNSLEAINIYIDLMWEYMRSCHVAL